MDEEGLDIESYDCPGEVYLKSPTVIQGYLDDKEANQTLLSQDGWLRTGDIGLFRISPNNAEHLFIVDRVKDMIKVKVNYCFDPLLLLLAAPGVVSVLIESGSAGNANCSR